MSWIYVPGLEGSRSPSDRYSRPRAPSVTWRGKPLPPRIWSREWNQGAQLTIFDPPPALSWIRLLSGATFGPSIADPGAASWISSLRGSRVSPSRLRVPVAAPMIRVISGPRSPRSFASFDPLSCSWRTCQDSSKSDSAKCSPTWPSSASIVNGRAYERAKSARLIVESGSSFWRTPTTFPTGGAMSGRERLAQGHAMTLQDQVADWPTPRAEDAESCGNHKGAIDSLTGACRTHGPPDPSTKADGPMVLNPRFVEALMGFPIGWTDFGL